MALLYLRECLKFCFNDVLQKELHEVQKLHNCHRIRPYPNQQCPSGKPNIICNIPQAFGKFTIFGAINEIGSHKIVDS